MANVWVKAVDGEHIRHGRITALRVDKVKGYGWVVMGHVGRGEARIFADCNRGGKAKRGAQRLCNELPLAIGVAKKDRNGATVTFVKRGYPKGGAQWSTLAAPPPGIRQIPVMPPDEPPGRRRDTGTG